MADSGTGRLQRSPVGHLPIRHALMAMCGLALASSAGLAGDAEETDAARAFPKAVPARINVATLGKPVLVSRADVEFPLGRVRSFQLDASSNTGESRVADPAFKAVLLTPRESTGRPVQPVIPLYELASGTPSRHAGRCAADKRQAATAKTEATTPAKPQPAGRPVQPVNPPNELASGPPHVTPADAPPTKGQAATVKMEPTTPAKPQPKRIASKPPASRPTPATPQHAAAGGANIPAVARRTAKPAEPKSGGGFGRAEIAATRAFTRF